MALALAARHPDLVRAAAIVATPAPQEAVPWIPEEHLAMIDQLRGDPGHATAALAEVFAEMAAMPPAAAVSMVGGGRADEAALAADPARRARLEVMLAEAMAQGSVGMAADIVSYTVAAWGFDLAAVGAPTTAFYGADDESVPPAHGRVVRGAGAGRRAPGRAGHRPPRGADTLGRRPGGRGLTPAGRATLVARPLSGLGHAPVTLTPL